MYALSLTRKGGLNGQLEWKRRHRSGWNCDSRVRGSSNNDDQRALWPLVLDGTSNMGGLVSGKKNLLAPQKPEEAMARLVTCVCGRRFHIGDGNANVQCRKCGRWWSGREAGILGSILTVLLGGDLARTTHKRGSYVPRSKNSCRRKQWRA